MTVNNKKAGFLEVGPRDGFQNVCDFIPTEVKLGTVDRLVAAGVKDMELTSFVSPKAIPQMADSREVAEYALGRYPEVNFWGLVPNMKGAENAYNAGIRHFSIVCSLSLTHNLKNVNRTHEQSFAELENIIKTYPDVKITWVLATAFGCPFEGDIPFERLLSFIKTGHELGVRRFCLCDTTGVALPNQVRKYVREIKKNYPDCHLAVHIHDTRNMGMVNSLAAIEAGADELQGSIGGLGGCPFAPGASGNTSSEDLIYMLNKMGYDTGVDFEKLLEAALYVRSKVKGNYSGHHINIEK